MISASELFASILPYAVGAFVGALVGGLIVLLGNYFLRRWELRTQYRISNVHGTYVPLSKEINHGVRIWKERSIRFSGISIGDTTPFVPDPVIWKSMESEGTSEVIRFSDPKLFGQIQSYYDTHYTKIASLGLHFRTVCNQIQTEWKNEIQEYQETDSQRQNVDRIGEELFKAVGDQLFIRRREEVLDTLRNKLEFYGKTSPPPLRTHPSIPENLYEKAKPKIEEILLRVADIESGGFLEDSERLLSRIRQKIGNPV